MARPDFISALFRAALLLAALCLAAPLAAQPVQPQAKSAACAPAGGASFICGVINVEDFAPIAYTRFVLGSSLVAPGAPGTLYQFDTGIRTARPINPASIAIKQDDSRFADCPGAPDFNVFAPHGLDLARGFGSHPTLYVVNHGGREAIEVFTVDLTKAFPSFVWVGCVMAPSGFWPDAVASLPDGGIVVTSLWDPTDNDHVNKLMNGKPVGGVAEWHPKKGWTPLPGTEDLSGPNGIIASANGKQVYIAAWSGKEVVRISRGPGKPVINRVPTEMLADNLRWAPDEKRIFVGGQDASVKQVLECFASAQVNCDVPTRIDAVDPVTLKLTPLVKSAVFGVFGAGTGAIQVGKDLWLSSFRSDRIAIVPLKP